MIERIAIGLVYLVGVVRLLPHLLVLTVCLFFIWHMALPVARACLHFVAALSHLIGG